MELLKLLKLTRCIKYVALMSLSMALVGCGKAEIDVNDYLDFRCIGYDTDGSATCYVEIARIIDDNLEAFGLDEDSSEKSYNRVRSKLGSMLVLGADSSTITTGLSNGDKVSFKWDEDDIEAVEEYFSIKLNAPDPEFTVKGLTEIEEFNPFDYVTVTFEGISSDGRININKQNDIPVDDISFVVEYGGGLSNGDIITVTARGDYKELAETCMDCGMKPTMTEKEYVVEGLSSYAVSLSEISEEALDKLDSHAQDKFNAYVAKEWSDAETLVSVDFAGNYLLFPKDASITTDANNYLYFIYEITAKNMENNENFKYYWYAYYTDIMILNDGTCSFDLNYTTVPECRMWLGSVSGEGFAIEDSNNDGNQYYYTGFKDIDSLFNNHVTAKIDSYDYESSVE